MKHVAVVFVLLVFLASGCGHSKRATLSPSDVEAGLRAAHLNPQEVTMSLVGPGTQPDGAVGFSGAVIESGLTYRPEKTFLVSRRTTVFVFPTEQGARQYNGFVNGMGSRVRNVLLVPPNRRVRDVVSRLR